MTAAPALAGLKQDYRTVDLCRKKLYNVNFSGQNLSKLKMRQSLFMGCNFDKADLTETDCEGSEFLGSSFKESILYRTNFRDAKLAGTIFEPRDCYGMTISLTCATFREMKVSQIWWLGFVFFSTLMRPYQGPIHEDLVEKLIGGVLGAERYVKLHALFGKREM